MPGAGISELFDTKCGRYADERLRLALRRGLELQFQGNNDGYLLLCSRCRVHEVTKESDPVFLIGLVDASMSPPVVRVRLFHNFSYVCRNCRQSPAAADGGASAVPLRSAAEGHAAAEAPSPSKNAVASPAEAATTRHRFAGFTPQALRSPGAEAGKEPPAASNDGPSADAPACNGKTDAPGAPSGGGLSLVEYHEVYCRRVKGETLHDVEVELIFEMCYELSVAPPAAPARGTAPKPSHAAAAAAATDRVSSTAQTAAWLRQNRAQLSREEVERVRQLEFVQPKHAMRTLAHTLAVVADWVLAPQALAIGPGTGLHGDSGGKPGSRLPMLIRLRPWALAVHDNSDIKQYANTVRPSLHCLGGRSLGKPPTSLLEVLNAPPIRFSVARARLAPDAELDSDLELEGDEDGEAPLYRPGFAVSLQRLAALLKRRCKRTRGSWRPALRYVRAQLGELLEGDAIYHGRKQPNAPEPGPSGRGSGGGGGNAGAAVGSGAADGMEPRLETFLRDLGVTEQEVVELLGLPDIDANVGFCVECGVTGNIVACDTCVDSFCLDCLNVDDPESLPDTWRCRYCEAVLPSHVVAGSAGGSKPTPVLPMGTRALGPKPEPCALTAAAAKAGRGAAARTAAAGRARRAQRDEDDEDEDDGDEDDVVVVAEAEEQGDQQGRGVGGRGAVETNVAAAGEGKRKETKPGQPAQVAAATAAARESAGQGMTAHPHGQPAAGDRSAGRRLRKQAQPRPLERPPSARGQPAAGARQHAAVAAAAPPSHATKSKPGAAPAAVATPRPPRVGRDGDHAEPSGATVGSEVPDEDDGVQDDRRQKQAAGGREAVRAAAAAVVEPNGRVRKRRTAGALAEPPPARRRRRGEPSSPPSSSSQSEGVAEAAAGGQAAEGKAGRGATEGDSEEEMQDAEEEAEGSGGGTVEAAAILTDLATSPWRQAGKTRQGGTNAAGAAAAAAAEADEGEGEEQFCSADSGLEKASKGSLTADDALGPRRPAAGRKQPAAGRAGRGGRAAGTVGGRAAAAVAAGARQQQGKAAKASRGGGSDSEESEEEDEEEEDEEEEEEEEGGSATPTSGSSAEEGSSGDTTAATASDDKSGSSSDGEGRERGASARKRPRDEDFRPSQQEDEGEDEDGAKSDDDVMLVAEVPAAVAPTAERSGQGQGGRDGGRGGRRGRPRRGGRGSGAEGVAGGEASLVAAGTRSQTRGAGKQDAGKGATPKTAVAADTGAGHTAGAPAEQGVGPAAGSALLTPQAPMSPRQARFQDRQRRLEVQAPGAALAKGRTLAFADTVPQAPSTRAGPGRQQQQPRQRTAAPPAAAAAAAAGPSSPAPAPPGGQLQAGAAGVPKGSSRPHKTKDAVLAQGPPALAVVAASGLAASAGPVEVVFDKVDAAVLGFRVMELATTDGLPHGVVSAWMATLNEALERYDREPAITQILSACLRGLSCQQAINELNLSASTAILRRSMGLGPAPAPSSDGRPADGKG